MPNTIKTVLGFDFGMKRIGVAIGQTITRSANPLTTLFAVDGIPKWEEIENLISIWQADALIVGLPYQLDGSEQQLSYAAKKFANRLKAKFKLPVFLVDERLTTMAAKSYLKEIKNYVQSEIDQYAAKFILESWLNSEGNS
jgi:putative holliday junction resolvase